MLAIVAPGQGAQQAGFLTPWLTERAVAERLDECSAAAGRNLAAAGTSMPAEAITDTAVAQPLIVAAGLAAAALLDLPDAVVFAGHSVGEFTAACLAGVLDLPDTMRLVTVRGREMAAASADPPSGMAAVLGGDAAKVTAAIGQAGCVAANYNGAGQIVAAGTREALDRLIADPPAGARIRPLAVAGAFHSPLMAGARLAVANAAAEVTPADVATGVVSNRDGTVVTWGAQLLERLVSQICLPVRWDLCMASLVAMGVTAVIELPPAGTLTAMIRRVAPDLELLSLGSPDDIPAARQLLDRHARVTAGAH
ncbi:MAG TPA: ACP S-malonyltransferase [Mycobacteriales bacterium]|nr:ACP S-malonyltransferase [Mycobacteriales bacterium]HWC34187.1 ACP S-malonyltransferase [Mycobacteriales bacterium]